MEGGTAFPSSSLRGLLQSVFPDVFQQPQATKEGDASDQYILEHAAEPSTAGAAETQQQSAGTDQYSVRLAGIKQRVSV